MKYWEIIIENLRNAGWNCGCISSTDHKGRQFWVVAAEREEKRFIVRADEVLTAFLHGRRIWIADAHRDDGKRFVARADEKLTAFLELETAIHEFAVDAMS